MRQFHVPDQHHVKIGLTIQIPGGKRAVDKCRVNCSKIGERLSDRIPGADCLEEHCAKFSDNGTARVDAVRFGMRGRFAQQQTRVLKIVEFFPNRAVLRADRLCERARVETRIRIQQENGQHAHPHARGKQGLQHERLQSITFGDNSITEGDNRQARAPIRVCVKVLQELLSGSKRVECCPTSESRKGFPDVENG